MGGGVGGEDKVGVLGNETGERVRFSTRSSFCAFPSTTDRLAALETWLSKPLPETLKENCCNYVFCFLTNSPSANGLKPLQA